MSSSQDGALTNLGILSDPKNKKKKPYGSNEKKTWEERMRAYVPMSFCVRIGS